MAKFTSGKHDLFYQSWGEGHPLILVHGWGSSTQSNWVDTGWVDALTQHRRMIGLDCLGHGKSDKPHEQALYSYRRLAEDVIALMDHLNIQSADYMGFSMGAFMGAALLGSHSERFTSFVLGGIGNETPESAGAAINIAKALRADNENQLTDPLEKMYRRFVTSEPVYDLEAMALSALQMWPEGYPLEVAGSEVNAAGVPVLIVNGSEDQPYIESCRQIAEQIPNVRVEIIDGEDHVSVVRNAEFKRVVGEFLAAQPRTDG